MHIPPPYIAFLGLSPGPFEILLLLAAVLMLFGAKRVPEFARSLGKVMEELRRASHDFKQQLMEVEEEIQEDTDPFTHEPPEFVVNRVQETEGDMEGEAEEGEEAPATEAEDPEKTDPSS